MIGCLVSLLLRRAHAGDIVITDSEDWAASSDSENIVPDLDHLEIDEVINLVDGWYRRKWNGVDSVAYVQKDDATLSSSPDRCMTLSANFRLLGPLYTTSGEEFRTGPHVEAIDGTSYLSTLPSDIDLPVPFPHGTVRLLVGGSHIAQRNLQVEFHYTDASSSTVVVPIPADTVIGLARTGAGANYTRTGVTGLVHTSDKDFDQNGDGLSDCGGSGADIVTVTRPIAKAISSISLRYADYDDSSANTGWLSGPIAMSLDGVDIEGVYTFRGYWASSLSTVDAISAGGNAIFHQIAWDSSALSGSEIALGLSCASDTSGNGTFEAGERSPEETFDASVDGTGSLAVPCSGTHAVLSADLLDSFSSPPRLYSATLTYDPDIDIDSYGALGAVTDADCDDDNPAVHPGAPEITGNGIDEDCTGTEICYADADQDGARDAALTTPSADADCSDPGEARSDAEIDCDDSDPERYPSAIEVVGDGIDEDCDGHDLCYEDLDRDGYGSEIVVASAAATCSTASSEATSAGDCDDDSVLIYPGASESVGDGTDQDCNGHDRCYEDADGDTYGNPAVTLDAAGLLCVGLGEATAGTDCDDNDDSYHPGAEDIAGNSADEDCDLRVLCYIDADDDGARSQSVTTGPVGNFSCSDPSEGTLDDPLDCNDTSASVYPGASEIAGDGIDQSCDGIEDCMSDIDGDGAQSGNILVGGANGDTDCDDPTEALLAAPFDCDDTEASIYPGAPEITSNGIDEDCDGAEICYLDDDGDLARSDETVLSSDLDCSDLFEAAEAAVVDCDDTNPAVSPLAEEECNALDDDCNDVIDDGSGPIVTWYADLDGDTYGDPLVYASGACGPDPSWVLTPGDCSDLDPAVNPGATELCNGIDDDCSDEIDDATPIVPWYSDSDGDGYGDPDSSVDAGCPPDDTFVQTPGDCDDSNTLVNPTAEEICNNIDDDCVSGIDTTGSPRTWYRDSDGDGFGVEAESIDADCPPGDGWADAAGDCDDSDPKLGESCLVGSGCGCESAPGGASLALPGLGLLIALKRRQRR